MRFIFLAIFIMPSTFSIAQARYEFGILPSINIKKKLPKDFTTKFKLESRQVFREGVFESKNDFHYDYFFTDFSVIASKKIKPDKSLGIGYFIRFKDGRIINRTLQQFVATKSYSGFKLSHRFLADQTFDKKKDAEFRFRYSLSSEIALKGASVDPQEFYLTIGNEYLNSFQKKGYKWEVRLVPHLGYKITDKKKFEFGLDYRINAFLNKSPLNRFWININWYQQF